MSQVIDGASVHLPEPPRIVKEQSFRSDEEGDDNHPIKPVIIKIEEDDDDCDYALGEEWDFNNFTVPSVACCDGNGGSTSSSSSVAAEAVPRPMEGLHDAGPPPFLRKTFEMVEDRQSDTVVSWSKNGESFVVWDEHQFSKDLLPKYFKHSNFSSFIRQLNTYGFRKIDPDRWDFAHEFFQRGKKPLLKNIRRRARPNQPRRGGISVDSKREVDFEAEAEILKRDQDKLRIEIVKLRQQQDIYQNEICTIEERIQCAENCHQRMFLFLAKAFKSPNFVQQPIQRKRSSQTRQIEMSSGQSKKRPRLDMPVDPEAAEFSMKVMKPELDDNTEKESSDFGVSEGDELIRCQVSREPESHETAPSGSAGGFSDVPEAYQAVSENLLSDSGIMLNDENTEILKESDLYMEFEGIIRRSQDWDGYGNEFLEPAAVGLM